MWKTKQCTDQKHDDKQFHHSVKSILYGAAQTSLTQSILTRPKQPFTLPIHAMLKKGYVLFDILYATLTSQKFISRGFF